MDTPVSRFVWFDYLTSEPAKAQAFFATLFGWKAQPYDLTDGSKYTMIVAGDQTIGGYAPPLPGTPTYRFSEPYARWLPYLQIANGHETSIKVKTLGGRMVREPAPSGYGGKLGVATDPNGQALGLWQPDQIPDDPGWAGPPNTFCWCELYSPTVASAVTFMKQVGGFSETKSQMPDGPYHLFEKDGQPRAGARKPMAGTQPGWFAWVRVPDIAATCAKAQQQDATIVQPPSNMGTMTMALLVDPWGATLGLVQ
jgi:predicted enzyme related to lactoylglutathione lyase